jgi:hypothetical protein
MLISNSLTTQDRQNIGFFRKKQTLEDAKAVAGGYITNYING